MTGMSDPRNVVLWNCGTPELLAVIEAMLDDPRVVIERTTVEHYRLSGMELIEDYDVEYAEEEVPLPAVDFGDEITPDGYDTPTWVPVMFAWAG